MEEIGIINQKAMWNAHVLRKRTASSDVSKLGQSIFDATVDLNPHQLDAALFAFRSPLSRGAILADEVGLGKTIEAALIISQLWAEHKRRILVVAPTILRKQWATELNEKFFLPAKVLDTKDFNASIKKGDDPLSGGQVLICSYHFAASRKELFASVPWNLVVIDEAHRLRNVWKPSNRIANALHDSLSKKPIVLLTATPLQNTLLELYGLVSFIDEHLFGGLDTFRARYMRGPLEDRQFADLQSRLQPICQRTLRRQVQEYVRFTNRIPITQDFTPSSDEQRLYDDVSDYLQRPNLHALPARQRALMTLILRKLLASSTFAISATLKTLANRLESNSRELLESLGEEYDALEEVAEEWGSEGVPDERSSTISPAEIAAEIEELRRFGTLAESITVNSKGQALLTALEHGFRKLAELGAQQKAVIFTESRRTQEYLVDLLSQNGFVGRVLTVNGTNTDDRAGTIYKEWLARHRGDARVTGNKAVDLRAALVEHFRDHADILIATEAASEGVNLQFCSLVVNFDLPWNPQRIEQRIGRCHRYGQQHDVVVVNFLNRSNEADRRVFELLAEKFQLFNGVFGSSDEILGALESGVDFERRIAEIYQSCRKREEIDKAFDELRLELDTDIQTRMSDTRAKLLENFDEVVHQKLKLNLDESERQLDRLERALWSVTKWGLAEQADFDDATYEFQLHSPPSELPETQTGRYRYVRQALQDQGALPYRLGHPLAQALIEDALGSTCPTSNLRFCYSSLGKKIGLLDGLVGKFGWAHIEKLTVDSFETEDHLLCSILLDEGEDVLSEAGDALFQTTVQDLGPVDVDESTLLRLKQRADYLAELAITTNQERNNRYFAEELDKLDRWADDLKHGLEVELKELDQQIKLAAKESKLAPTLDAKLEIVKRQKELEQTRNRKRRELFDAQDQIDAEKGQVIEQVEARLRQNTVRETLMIFKFEVE
jgi:superfamily II DNA or RNA helicase